MQRLLEIPQEVYGFLRNFRLRAGDWNRAGGSKTAPITHPCQEYLLLLQRFLFCNRPFLLCKKDHLPSTILQIMSTQISSPTDASRQR